MGEKKEASLEELFMEIEAVVQQLEAKDVSLEQSFLLYEEGMRKLKQCSDKIDRVEKKMLVISGQGELQEFA